MQRRIGQRRIGQKLFGGALAACIVLGAGAATAEEVGKVGVDWVGNDIIVEAIKDPQVEGVTCHVSYFDRSVVDRLKNGNWFEDPSNTAIACRQTGPITIGEIDLGKEGDEIFEQGISLIWKKQVVNRIYDKKNETLIYLSHSRQVQGRLGENVGDHRAAVRPERGVDQRQAEIDGFSGLFGDATIASAIARDNCFRLAAATARR